MNARNRRLLGGQKVTGQGHVPASRLFFHSGLKARKWCDGKKFVFDNVTDVIVFQSQKVSGYGYKVTISLLFSAPPGL